MNGNNFVSKTEITQDMFKGKLGRITITDNAEADDTSLIGEHKHMELVQIAHYTQATHGCTDGQYFVLREITGDLRMLRIDWNRDYIAMMKDIKL